METNERAIELQRQVETELPSFVKMMRTTEGMIVLHQDAFAADYQEKEYALLGMAIKYAGIFNREVHIHGRNRDTIKVGS